MISSPIAKLLKCNQPLNVRGLLIHLNNRIAGGCHNLHGKAYVFSLGGIFFGEGMIGEEFFQVSFFSAGYNELKHIQRWPAVMLFEFNPEIV